MDEDPKIPPINGQDEEIVVELVKICFDRFDKRRDYEWKMNFGIWAALGIIIGHGISTPGLPLAYPGGSVIWLVHGLTALAYLYWTVGLYSRNKKDKTYGLAHLKTLEKGGPLSDEDKRKIAVSGVLDDLTPYWPHLASFLLTLVMLFVSLLLYLPESRWDP